MSFRTARAPSTLAASILLFAIAIWIIVPAPVLVLLPIGVAASEVSAWLLVVAILLGGAAAFDVRSRRAARVALALSCSVAILAAVPLIRVAMAIPRMDQAMRAGLGDHYLEQIPANARDRMRPGPIVVGDLFRGFDSGNARSGASILFESAGGTALRMDVYTPASAGPHPTIVQIYGGAWQRGSPDDHAAVASYFAAHGYVVFAIDYRHAPEWRWTSQIDDVRAALRWIGQHGAEHGADTSRVALVGRSSGAQLALVAACTPGSIPVQAVVDLYGPTDLAGGYRVPPRPDPLDVRAVLRAFLGGTPDQTPEAYRDASPLTCATRPLPPTLLIYGGRDHVVSPRFGAALHQRLQSTGTRSVLLELPWAEHAFDTVPFGPGAQVALYYTERFVAWALSNSAPRRP